ncbi:MAG: hypothetical protein NTV93_12510 [Verrucomicrobia bacterium]|nr:hypothetical protein [Verrucomicrobiota bacterium]
MPKDILSAARPLQLRVLDHVIVTDDSVFSFSDSGLLDELAIEAGVVQGYFPFARPPDSFSIGCEPASGLLLLPMCQWKHSKVSAAPKRTSTFSRRSSARVRAKSCRSILRRAASTREAMCASNSLESVSLGELLDAKILRVRGGHGSPSNDRRSGTIPYIRVSDIRSLRMNVNPTNLVTEAVAESFWGGKSRGLWRTLARGMPAQAQIGRLGAPSIGGVPQLLHDHRHSQDSLRGRCEGFRL